MRINHLDLLVHDVTASAAYFVRHFGLQLQSNPTSPALAILTDEQGFVLVLQRMQERQPYPDGFHLGFLLDTVEEVHAMHARVAAEGAPVSEVIVNGRGTMIYLTTPEGYRVEVSCQRHRFPPASANDVHEKSSH